jgi:hypothetical protein
MIKFFRAFIVLLAIATAAAAVVLFYDTDRQSKKLDEVKLVAEIGYSQWEQQNECAADPVPCDESAYSKQFKSWHSQFQQYTERRKQHPKFQYYLFLKELDKLYAPDLNSGGWAALAVGCASLLLFVFLIAYLLGGSKKNRTPRFENTARRTGSMPMSRTVPASAGSGPKPDIKALLRKASECAENQPAQAITYLEQAIEGSLNAKLSIPTLLLCGSLRLKNKMGEAQGREQLRRVISVAPKSPEAKKAQIVLDTFK